MPDRMVNKTAIVTGAAGGIGRAVAMRFAAEGAKVMAVDINDPSDLALELGSKAIARKADISNTEEVRALVDEVRERWGHLDVLANVAAISGGNHPTADVPEEVFNRVLAVNVGGVFLTMKHAIPLMLEGGGGSIINVASIAAFVGSPGSSAYAASKGAVMMLTKNAAIEYNASAGIRINAVCPGMTRTPMLDELADDRLHFAKRHHPIGRLGLPEEIAFAVLFLASDESSFVTGAPIIVDGGRMANGWGSQAFEYLANSGSEQVT